MPSNRTLNPDDLAPVVLFVYNRPVHTARVLEALSANHLAEHSHLIVLSDGPTQSSQPEVEQTRAVIRSKKWCGSVEIVEQETNLGLAKSITSGVTNVVERYGRVIVLEDDIVTSPHFLTYMNEALSRYEDEEKVMHVAGFFYPVRDSHLLPDTFFYNANSCWGWATWARAWKHYSDDAHALLANLQDMPDFNQTDYNKGQGRAFYEQVEDNASGRISTWAAKWHASMYLRNGHCLHPSQSLVDNIGIDGTGQNSGFLNFGVNSAGAPTAAPNSFPAKVEECQAAIDAVRAHYNSNPVNKLRQVMRWFSKTSKKQ